MFENRRPWNRFRIRSSSVGDLGLSAGGISCCVLLTVCLCDSRAIAVEESTERVSAGLVALYDFSETEGTLIHDRAGSRDPLDLKIENLDRVERKKGSLEIRGTTLIRNQKPAKRLSAALKGASALTIEAWIRPQNKTQAGPARIITLSKDSSNRNVTLGQDGNAFDVRLRTVETSANGIPSFATRPGSLGTKLTHVVYTRDRKGNAVVWLDGKRSISKRVGGAFSNWDTSMQLALGNEVNGSRPWRGTYHLVAIYRRALNSSEVKRNYAAGAGAAAPPILARKPRDPRETHFELNVAPILANQCLECHDTLTRQGGLDLSRKIAALEGGESGPVIVANNAEESLFWQSVESDDMPHERAPLSESEKQTLKGWIDNGGVWSLDTIDAAVYVHGGRPDASWLRRLTISEYIETVRSLFGLDISEHARELLPPDVRADGFSNTAYNQFVDLKHIEAYQKLAEIIVQRIDVSAFHRQFMKKLAFTDKDMGELISRMGQRILRGPLETREVIQFRGISTTIAATEDGQLEEAVAAIIEAMLQSPRFIYRMERQPDSNSEDAEPVNEYELASRMSYIIWGAPPDSKLYSAAEEGDLYSEESIAQQCARMLQDPRAIEQSKRFYSDWLNLGRLKNMQPSAEKYPNWSIELAEDMRQESLAFFDEVVWKQGRPLSDLLNAKVTFATPRLAKHYGLPPEAADFASSSGALVRFDLNKAKARGGMLTQGSLLTVGGDHASMVTRGLLVMHELLRGVVKDPPACVDTTPIPTEPGLSQRMIAADRIANSTCGGCHSRFEPLAFGLERFDGLGTYHEKDEHGNVLREDGEIVFPGASEAVRYQTAAELMDLMASSNRVKESITWKLTQFALGRPLTAIDAGAVQLIHQRAQKAGGTYAATMTAIVTSELVTMTQAEY